MFCWVWRDVCRVFDAVVVGLSVTLVLVVGLFAFACLVVIAGNILISNLGVMFVARLS